MLKGYWSIQVQGHELGVACDASADAASASKSSKFRKSSFVEVLEYGIATLMMDCESVTTPHDTRKRFPLRTAEVLYLLVAVQKEGGSGPVRVRV